MKKKTEKQREEQIIRMITASDIKKIRELRISRIGLLVTFALAITGIIISIIK